MVDQTHLKLFFYINPILFPCNYKTVITLIMVEKIFNRIVCYCDFNTVQNIAS